ncbi:MAG: lipopolysaccharide heptosyltransferase II [bacterium]|nr:lipopolysaccharide heptosyltransferase II [bacterium]
MNIKKIKKILLIQTAFLGDIILTIPLINNLRNFFPDKEITILTTPLGKTLLEEQKNIDQIIVYDKKGKDKGFFNILKLVETLSLMSFDWVISPHRSFRTALIGYLARIPHRSGFSNSEGRFLFNDLIEYKKSLYDLERNLYFLENFCENPLKLDTKIDFPFNNLLEKETGDTLAKRSWSNEKIIGIHTGSKWFTKKWPINNFKQLLKELVDKGYKLIIFGDEDDWEISQFVTHELESDNILNLVAKTDIKQLISYFRKIAVYVTNDSGPMHIAAALGFPIVAIFGPTVRELGFFPYTDTAIVVEEKLVCRPCGKHGGMICPQKHFKCMKNIKVVDVVRAIESFIV